MSNIIEIGGGGASGGSNVVANPVEAATDTLSKIGIDGTVYEVSGGGGSGYSETELLSAPVQVGASSITLTNNISNYDLLVFEVGVFADNINQTFTSIALVSNIINAPNDKTFISGACSANNQLYSIYFGIKYSSETILTIMDSNRTGWAQTGQIISVKGIKFGGSNSGHNYSTSEQIVGTWIDGSPIYERTYTNINLTHNTWNNDILGTSGSGITILEFDGKLSIDNTTPYCNLDYYRNASEYTCVGLTSNSGFNVYPCVSNPEKILFVMIRYIKPNS